MPQEKLFFGPEENYDPDLVHVLEENIRTSVELQKKARQRRSFEQRLSDRVASIASHISFLYIHLVIIIVHILINSGWFGNKPYDPYPFSLLIGIITVEVLFLSTLILISQNRDEAEADRRAELDLQMSMLNQYEITRILKMLEEMEAKVGITHENDPELQKLKEQISPKDVLREIEMVQQQIDEDKKE
ncbi:MAG TPA: DUF1003 domain-containing protein [Anaerolineaceae bacterium]|jgi:uncharacterized membrane protein|nr:DUF1003 domain-containing protein [Anaerolineaceae bacterium]HOT25137.1 DUF1003 domain-containing protein [Anaerolineaceae bacterium]HQH57931.1 DUF1003 domain-containing protein [Anaerolineaceae bacterium]HQK02802.1 DUF1003 domain-containing protein [Anaerolineaceae bacterium]HQL26921.1 DUF1003 domain-containing protein [Anaerolineaceae bacterium]